MFKFILVTCFVVLTSAICVESIYIHSVVSIEGVAKPLSAYQGKKILIVTLPIQRNNTNDTLLRSLDSLENVYSSSLTIIGVPSVEDGYQEGIKDSLKQWYRSFLNMNIIVTQGSYTRKTSGSQQHPLFKLLTDKNRNNHFNKDVEGPGNKFFIWTDGKLVGVFGAPTSIKGNALNNLLQN